MVIHSSIATATAAAHVQELLADARRRRSGRGGGAAARRILAWVYAAVEKSGADRRCAVPR